MKFGTDAENDVVNRHTVSKTDNNTTSPIGQNCPQWILYVQNVRCFFKCGLTFNH